MNEYIIFINITCHFSAYFGVLCDVTYRSIVPCRLSITLTGAHWEYMARVQIVSRALLLSSEIGHEER